MSFEKADVIRTCEEYGKQLQVPYPIDGIALMKAIAQVESSMGLNCKRHEPAYDTDGQVWKGSREQQALVKEFGSDAACSFGPWQVMFLNVPTWFVPPATPEQMETDLDVCARAFVEFFNRYVIRTRQASTVPEIGQVYNGGHIFKEVPAGVQRYCDQLAKAYLLFVKEHLGV